MVEVFKTNVTDHRLAARLIAEIRQRFDGYTANFDLGDCDRILRVKGERIIKPAEVIALLNGYGCYAEALVDNKESQNLNSGHNN